MPKHSPGYEFRTTIDLGDRTLLRKTYVSDHGVEIKPDGNNHSWIPPRGCRVIERYIDGREILREMAQEYMGTDYDLLRKNCCTFAHDACLQLGVKEEEIPQWFRNLCYAGAVTQDAAMSATRPITTVLTACDCENVIEGGVSNFVDESGFEVLVSNKTSIYEDGSSNDDSLHRGAGMGLNKDSAFRRATSSRF